MRIKIAQSVLDKAGKFGLADGEENTATLLKRMARLSAIASGNFNDQRRRYGSFILTMRGNDVVDINCNDDDYCDLCLGIGVDEVGEDCPCTDDYDLPDASETIGGNHW